MLLSMEHLQFAWCPGDDAEKGAALQWPPSAVLKLRHVNPVSGVEVSPFLCHFPLSVPSLCLNLRGSEATQKAS